MLATFLNEADSLAVPQVSMSHSDHGDSHESDCRDLTEDHIDYEDSLEVQVDDLLFRSTEGHEKPEENRSKRNNLHRPSPGTTQRQHYPIRHVVQDDDDSLEDLNEKQQRPTISQHDHKTTVQNHQLMDRSDEQPSWEVKDESLKKLFGVYWESIKDKKRYQPSIEDSMEDMGQQQHKAQPLARIPSRHTF